MCLKRPLVNRMVIFYLSNKSGKSQTIRLYKKQVFSKI